MSEVATLMIGIPIESRHPAYRTSPVFHAFSKMFEDIGSESLLFWCPACGRDHEIDPREVNAKRLGGTFDEPTIDGVVDFGRGCRATITDGVLEYADDCDHAHAGRTTPMEPITIHTCR